jgi:transglutaminase-like putative cysteine protease
MASSITLAMLCVLLGHVLPPGSSIVLAVPWLAAWMGLRGRPWPLWGGTALALVAFGLAAARLMVSGLGSALVAACIALLGILIARLLTRRTPAHDLHSLVLSLLLVFAGTVLQQHISYGLVLLAYTVSVTWALVTRQLIHGAAMQAFRSGEGPTLAATLQRRDVVTPRFFAATAAVALVLLVLSAVLFVAFPRVGMGGVGFGGRQGSRFPGDVSLAGPPRAGGDDTIVARLGGVPYADFVRGLYVRGSIYDAAGATGFSASPSLLAISPHRLALAAEGAADVVYDVYLQPVAEQVLLSLGPVAHAVPVSGAFAGAGGLERIGLGPSGELTSMTPLLGPVRYRVRGQLTRAPPALVGATAGAEALGFDDPKFAGHFLALPPQLDPRVVPLAQHAVGDAATFAQKASRLRAYLLANYAYSLQQANSGRTDPLAGFLFDDRRGHCEYFATAFAVLLRAVGVPSRVVGGFQGGVWDTTGPTVLLAAAHAHAWVEWYAPNLGWVTDDATPFRPAPTLTGAAAWMEQARRFWDDQIVDFGLDQQLAMWRGVVGALHSGGISGLAAAPTDPARWRQMVRPGLAVGLIAACSVLGTAWVRLRRRRRTTQAGPLAGALLAALQRVNRAPVPKHLPLRQAVQAAAPRLDEADAAQLQAALAAYEAQRFAGATLAPKRVRALLSILKRLNPAVKYRAK